MASEPDVRSRFARSFARKGFLPELLITAAVGMGIVLLMALEQPSGIRWQVFVYGAFIGVTVYLVNALLGATCGGWIDRISLLPPWLTLSIVFFVGGCVGWILATLAANAMGLVRVSLAPVALKVYVPLAGAIAILVGLSLYTYSRLRERLEENVERLKEAEFAEKELELARAIQERILPPAELSGEGYRITARNLPARFVAGDFYDVFRLPDGAVGVAVADVAGKGMGASLIMATAKAVLPFLAAERTVAETLREGNRRMKPRLAAREFVALVYLRYDPTTGDFAFANAGLPDPYLLAAGRPARALSAPGPRFPLGVRQEVAYEAFSGTLQPGERLIILTDGLPEAPGADGGPLGYEKFEELLSGASGIDALFESVRSATQPVLADDWTALLLERSS